MEMYEVGQRLPTSESKSAHRKVWSALTETDAKKLLTNVST